MKNKNNKVSMTVRYLINFDELDEFSKAIKGFGERVMKYTTPPPCHVTIRRKKFRRDNILNVLLKDGEFTSGELYKKVKKINQRTYKTFHRDILELITMNKIETEVIIGGKNGTTTKIKLTKMESD